MAAPYLDFFGIGGGAPVVYAPGGAPNPRNPGGISDNALKVIQKAAAVKLLASKQAVGLKAAKAEQAKRLAANKPKAGSALKDLGKLAKAGIGLVSGATLAKAVANELAKVPVIGSGLGGALVLANVSGYVAEQIASGERLDRVAMDTLKKQVSAAQAVAPYVQTVLSVVPVVGTGLNAGLGAGLALASGQGITEALAAAVKSALPGGPLAQAAFTVARGVVAGKPLDQLALAALPIDATARKALTAGLDAARRVAKGERVDKALMAQASRAIELLPPQARAALTAGIAIGSGQVLQAATALAGAAGVKPGDILQAAASSGAALGGSVIKLGGIKLSVADQDKIKKASGAVKAVAAPVKAAIKLPAKAVLQAAPKALTKAVKATLPKTVNAAAANVAKASVAKTVSAVAKQVATASAAKVPKPALTLVQKALAVKPAAVFKTVVAAKPVAVIKSAASTTLAKTLAKAFPTVKAIATKNVAPAVKTTTVKPVVAIKPATATPLSASLAKKFPAVSAAATKNATPLVKTTAATIKPPTAALTLAPLAKAPVTVAPKGSEEGFFIPMSGPNAARVDFTQKFWKRA